MAKKTKVTEIDRKSPSYYQGLADAYLSACMELQDSRLPKKTLTQKLNYLFQYHQGHNEGDLKKKSGAKTKLDEIATIENGTTLERGEVEVKISCVETISVR